MVSSQRKRMSRIFPVLMTRQFRIPTKAAGLVYLTIVEHRRLLNDTSFCPGLVHCLLVFWDVVFNLSSFWSVYPHCWSGDSPSCFDHRVYAAIFAAHYDGSSMIPRVTQVEAAKRKTCLCCQLVEGWQHCQLGGNSVGASQFISRIILLFYCVKIVRH